MTTTPKNGRALTFDAFRERCTPGLWQVKVRTLSPLPGDPGVNTTIAFPQDRNLENALATHGLPPGRYAAAPYWPGPKGDTWMQERRKIYAGKWQHTPRGILTLTADLAADPRPQEPVGAVASSKAESARLRFEAEAEQHRLVIAEAKSKREALERGNARDDMPAWAAALIAELRTSREAPSKNPLQPLLEQQQRMFDLMLEQERNRARELQAQLLAERDHAPPPPLVDPLAQLTQQLAVFKEVKELLRNSDEGGSDGGLSARDWIPLFRDMMARQPAPQGPAGQANPPTLAAPPGAPPAAALPSPQALGQQRARQLVEQLVQEALVGSDPEAAADRLEELVLAQPALLRAAIQSGDLDKALAVLHDILSPEDSKKLKELMAQGGEPMRAWVGEFVKAQQLQDEAEGEPQQL